MSAPAPAAPRLRWRRRGAVVTGVDASEEMLAVAAAARGDAQATVTFARATRTGCAFADASFDAVVCLRVLMHTPDWRRSLAELCRVARERVVFDYPALVSAAALQAVARRSRRRPGHASRPTACSPIARCATRFERSGFRVVERHRQFVLPIALHKRLDRRRRPSGSRACSRGSGCARLLGSPVTVVAERCAS